MKMLMTAMLALSLLTGAVSVSFAADDKAEKKEHKKKGKKAKKDEAKKS